MNYTICSKFRLFLLFAFLLIAIDGRAQVTNGKVAFVRGSDIFTTYGGDVTNITNNQLGNQSPIYSPDGAKILFTSSRNGGNRVFVMNADGSNVTQLTNSASSDKSPSFSSDGTKILFARSNLVFVMNADGSNPISLTSGFNEVDSPKFSPDGSKIVFAGRTSFGGFSIYLMNADGSNLELLLNQPTDGTNNHPSYSPDGTKLLFRSQNTSSFLSKIYLSNPNGSGMTAIVQAEPLTSPISTPVFSPDGTKILYTEQYSFSPVRLQVTEYTIAGGARRRFVDDATNPAWQPVRPALPRTKFDFDGDGRADIGVFRPGNGTWYLSNSTAGFSARPFGVATDQLVPADYDGDGRTDIAVFRRSENSTWYIFQSATNTFRAAQWGATNILQPILFDIVAPGDYDGDGRADLAIFRTTDDLSEPARFLILQSSNNSPRNEQWGASFDSPIPADYDGDGKTDLAVIRGNVWYINQSAAGLRSVTFGTTGDKLVPADYDGDNKADIAVYRPSNGVWYLQRSQLGFTGITFGIASDLTVPADYDGDGKADVAVYRGGIWYLNRSQLGITGISFGAADDKPVVIQ